MEILITRHGQTDWNVQEKLQGKADIELNQTGIEQAKIAKNKLENEKIDLIICSPLKRAKQTAEIINEGRNIPLIIDDRIAERDFGEFEGKNKSKFSFEDFWSYKKAENYEKAEKIQDFFERIYNFLDDIKEKYKDKRILIVAHGGVSIPFRCYFEGIPDIENLTGLGLDNCEIGKYTFK